MQKDNNGDYLLFKVKGNSGIYSYLTITREVRLDASRPVVKFAVSYHNDPNSVGVMQIYPWMHHHIGFSPKDTFFISSPDGVREIPRKEISTDSMWYNPTRGFMALTSGDGRGIASRMDYPNLRSYYSWSQGLERATFEWRLFPITLKQDETFVHKYNIVYFQGIDSPGDVSVDGDVLQLKVEPAGKAKLRVASKGVLYGKKWQWKLERGDVKGMFAVCATGETADGNVIWEGDMPNGVSVWRMTLTDGDKKMYAEVPFSADGTFAGYRMADEAPRIIPANFDVKRGATEEYIQTISHDYMTPFYPWCVPAVHKEIRALALVPASGMREVMELEQRFGIKCDTLYINQGPPFINGDFNGADLDPQSIAVIRNKIAKEKYDLVILGGLFSGKYLPGKTGERLAQMVREEGVGLIIVNTDGLDDTMKALLPAFDGKTAQPAPCKAVAAHPIISGFSPELLGRQRANRKFASGGIIEANGNTLLSAVEAGKGRIVVFDYPVHANYGIVNGGTLTPYTPLGAEPGNSFDYDYYEYFLALVGRAALWCTHRDEAMAAVEKIDVSPSGLVSLRLKAMPKVAPATMEVVLNDAYGREICRTAQEPRIWNNSIEAHLPQGLLGGVNRIKVRLLDNEKKVLAFAAAQINGNYAVPNVRIWKPENGKMKVRVDATNGAGTIEMALFDGLERLCESKSVPLAALWNGEISTERMLSNAGWLVVEIRDEKRNVRSVRKVAVKGARPHDDTKHDYRVVCAGLMSRFAVPYYIQKYYFKYLRDLGVTHMEEDKPYHNASEFSGFYIYKHALGGMAESRVAMGESRDGYNSTRNKKFLVRKRDFANPEFLKAEENKITSAISQFVSTAGDWIMIDEDEYSIDGLDYDFSDYSLNAFREWEKSRYGSLEKLNAQWCTNYKDWSEVVPETLLESQERKDHNHSSYVDHRLFNNHTVATAWRFYKGILNREEPKALMSISGTRPAAPYGGNDYYQLGQVLDMLFSYPNYVMQYPTHLAFFPDKQIFPWLGYREDDADKLFWWMFQTARGGMCIFSASSMVRHDLSDYYTTGHAMKNALAPIIRGRGQLLSWTPRPAKIAVHFSMPSKHAARVVGLAKLQDESYRGFLQMLEEANLPHTLIASQQIENGELTPERFNLLILPCSIAISEKEAEHIKAFVKNGGHVLADALPGVMDGHGRLLAESPLSSLFGVKISGLEMTKPSNDSMLAFSAMAGTPVQKKAFGKGKATLLGGFPGDIYMFMSDNSGQEIYRKKAAYSRAVLTEIAANADVPPSVVTEAEQEGRIQALEYDGNGGECYLVIKPSGVVKNAKLKLPQKRHWFNSLTGEKLADGDSVTMTIAHPVILAGFNEIPPIPECTVQGDGVCGGSLTFSVPALESIRQVFHFEFFAPDGAPLHHYDGNAENNGGKSAQFTLPLALNDASGEWKVVITDACTGRVTSKTFVVK